MKRSILFVGSALLVMGGVAACANQDDSQSPSQPVASAQDELITGPMGPIFWPTAAISWNAGVGTWPIAIWSQTPINWLAFSIPGAASLSATLTAMSGAAISNFAATAVPVSSAILNSVGAGNWLGGLTPYYGMFPWMYGLNGYPYFGAPGYVYGLGYYPYIGTTVGAIAPALTPSLINGLAYPNLLPAGLTGVDGALTTIPTMPFLTPTLTSSALMFNTFPAFVGTTPFLLNLTFSGITASQMASLNLFTATAAASAAATAAAASANLQIQATLFPIMGVPVTLPIIP